METLVNVCIEMPVLGSVLSGIVPEGLELPVIVVVSGKVIVDCDESVVLEDVVLSLWAALDMELVVSTDPVD